MTKKLEENRKNEQTAIRTYGETDGWFFKGLNKKHKFVMNLTQPVSVFQIMSELVILHT